jgi:hypothetical protein
MHPCEKTRHPASHNVQKPPAKIAIPKIGSDVAATPSPGELREAVLHTPVAAAKMSTALDGLVPSTAEIERILREINTDQTQQISLIPHMQPHQKALQCVTAGRRGSTTYLKRTYIRQQRLQDSAEMWLQEHTGRLRDLQCSTKIRVQPAGQRRLQQKGTRSAARQQPLEGRQAAYMDALVVVWVSGLQEEIAAA